MFMNNWGNLVIKMQKAVVPSKFILGNAWVYRASRKSATIKSGIGIYGYDIKRYEINKNIELMAAALQIEDKGDYSRPGLLQN